MELVKWTRADRNDLEHTVCDRNGLKRTVNRNVAPYSIYLFKNFISDGSHRSQCYLFHTNLYAHSQHRFFLFMRTIHQKLLYEWLVWLSLIHISFYICSCAQLSLALQHLGPLSMTSPLTQPTFLELPSLVTSIFSVNGPHFYSRVRQCIASLGRYRSRNHDRCDQKRHDFVYQLFV